MGGAVVRPWHGWGDAVPDKLGMVAVELQHDGAAPGEDRDMRRAARERVYQCREAVRVVRQAEIRWHVRRATSPWLVPRHNGELVRQGGELWLPHAGIDRGAVHKYQGRPAPTRS